MDKNTWIGLGVAVACLAFVFLTRNGSSENTEALEKATMEIHDEAMLELADVNRMARTLKEELPKLDSLSARRDSILRVLQQIQTAEEDMYAWMREYKTPAEMPPGKAGGYLEEQKQKIDKNYTDLQAAREAAYMLLPKN